MRSNACSRSSIWYFCEILGLFVVWRTYRLTVVAVIYALFVPAACITEGLPCGSSTDSRKPKFFLSILIWFCILAIAIAATLVSESSDQVQEIRTMVIVAVSVACGAILCSSVSVKLKRAAEESAVPVNVKALRAFRPFAPSWSNILALLTAPLEAIQMSAVGKLICV